MFQVTSIFKRWFTLSLLLLCAFSQPTWASLPKQLNDDAKVDLVQERFKFTYPGGRGISHQELLVILQNGDGSSTLLQTGTHLCEFLNLKDRYKNKQYRDASLKITDEMFLAVLTPPGVDGNPLDVIFNAAKAEMHKSEIANGARGAGALKALDDISSIYSNVARLDSLRKLIYAATDSYEASLVNNLVIKYKSSDMDDSEFWDVYGETADHSDRYNASKIKENPGFITRDFVRQTVLAEKEVNSATFNSQVSDYKAAVNKAIKNFKYPVVSIANTSVKEGNLGNVNMAFQVSVANPWALPITITYSTRAGTARTNEDFVGARGTLTLLPNVSKATIIVSVRGDLNDESNETFFLDFKVAGISQSAAFATGTIVDDDTLALSIADARVKEGNSGTTRLDFKISLSLPAPADLPIVCVAVDKTAKVGDDYRKNSSPAVIRRGQFSGVFSILINGDTKVESDESFSVSLAPTTYKITRGTATGTILNDDQATPTPRPTATPQPTPTAIPQPTATPIPSAASGKIAFSSYRDGNYEIYVMNADGTNQTRLTYNTTEDNVPKFSPDGSKITFMSYLDGKGDNGAEICVMNADGTNQTRLTNNDIPDVNPVFSPDGSKILFESRRATYPSSSAICIMDADGSNQTYLTNYDTSDFSPVFAPDGKKIAFLSLRSGGPDHIYVMNVDGSSPTCLTNSYGSKGGLVFSPDGSKIAFGYNDLNGGDNQIYIMNVDGTNLTRLTYNTSNNGFVTFSPDGSRIVFVSYPNRDNSNSPGIYMMNADGTNQTYLPNSVTNISGPNALIFSPDGKKIEFNSSRDGNYEIYVMNADGTNQTRLTNNIANDFAFSWTSGFIPAPLVKSLVPKAAIRPKMKSSIPVS